MAIGTLCQAAETRPRVRDRQDWIGRTTRALAFGLSDLDSVVIALAGFLFRGGILVLLLPAVVLPSLIGVAGAAGVSSFAIDGRPTLWLFEVALVIALIVGAWLLLSFVVGSVIDIWLIGRTRYGDAADPDRAWPLPEMRAVLDLAAIRSICVLPLLGAAVWAGTRIYSVAYTELTTPTNFTTPVVLRVIEGAADAVFLVVVIWLVTETVAAIAVRRFLLLGEGVWQAIEGAFAQIWRRPLTTVGTVAVSYGASVIAAAVAFVATSTAFDWCRIAARNQHPIAVSIGAAGGDARPIVFILASITLGLAWMIALALSGIASAWRSAAFTGETNDPAPDARTGPDDRLGLSGSSPERSGD